MSTLIDTALRVESIGGDVVIYLESGREIRFPAAANPRLARGTPAQLTNVEIFPFGIHWPDLDEDLSISGLLEGNFGQRRGALQK